PWRHAPRWGKPGGAAVADVAAGDAGAPADWPGVGPRSAAARSGPRRLLAGARPRVATTRRHGRGRRFWPRWLHVVLCHVALGGCDVDLAVGVACCTPARPRAGARPDRGAGGSLGAT